ncbi:MAG: M48 family metallopeptidase [Planctomycetota bacterium]|nr:M48 family metallopeptidase [Planctomycetota bacterium]
MTTLSPDLYQHPLDRESFLNLQAISWLAKLPKMFVMEDVERDYHLFNLADNVVLRHQDHPKLHDSLDRALDALNYPHRPDLFLQCDPAPHSFCFGEKEPMIVLSSGLLDLLDDDERTAVLAHEVGHLACGHTFYQMIAQNFASLAQLSGVVPFAGAVSYGARVPLYDWYRKADLSADRAALIVCGDAGLLVRTIAKLAGGKMGGVTPDALLEQARLLERLCEEMKAGTMRERATYYFSTLFLQGFLRTQPYPAMRAHEATQWAKTPVYAALNTGHPEEAARLLAAETPSAQAPDEGGFWKVGGLWEDFVGLFGGEKPDAKP